MSEKVMVFHEGHMEGFKFIGASSKIEDFNEFFFNVLPHACFMDRVRMERNPEFKQIIPYTLVRYNGKFLAYKRSKTGGEGRLHNKWSIGFGGHINPEDDASGSLQAAIGMCMAREMTEELEWTEPAALVCAEYKETALLYDPSNDVGKVHFGVVMSVMLPPDFNPDTVKIAEDAIAEIRWVTREEAAGLENLENWSRILLGVL
jgi:predicted NUDIX family phosphoesterase